MSRFVVFKVSGDVLEVVVNADKLDFENSSIICSQVVNALGRNQFPDTIVDVSNVIDMSSAGIGFLMHVKDILAHHGREMKLRCENHSLREFMGFLRVTPLFDLVASGVPSRSLDASTPRSA